MSFDPEKVERPYVKEWGHHAVYASDYDQLLQLYRRLRDYCDTRDDLPQSLWGPKRVAEESNRQQGVLEQLKMARSLASASDPR